MNIKTKYNVGDKVFLFEDRKCYKAKIDKVIIKTETKDDKDIVVIRYDITQYIPAGLLKTEEENLTRKEERIFTSKDDVQKALDEIAAADKAVVAAEKKVDELDNKFPEDSEYITSIWGSGIVPYYQISNN